MIRCAAGWRSDRGERYTIDWVGGVPVEPRWTPWRAAPTWHTTAAKSAFRVGQPKSTLGGLRFNVGGTFAPIGLGGLHITIASQADGGMTTVRREVVRLLADQSFLVDSSKLTATGRARLERLQRRLSRQRVRSIERILLAGLAFRDGVVEEHAHGEERKVATTLADSLRAFDRRVDIVIRWGPR